MFLLCEAEDEDSIHPLEKWECLVVGLACFVHPAEEAEVGVCDVVLVGETPVGQ